MKVWTLLLLTIVFVSGEKCRALILSGGGAYGAYEVGVFQGLVATLPAAEVAYDVISGISVGSMNAVALSMFPKGLEVQASQFLTNFWVNVGGAQNVIAYWPGGTTQGLLFESGIFDTTPFHNYVLKNCVNPPVRFAVVGTTSLNTGAYVTYNNTGRTIQDFIQIFMASSAIPEYFPTVKYNNDVYTDGGVIQMMDIISGIDACIELGASPSDIIVDMVSCYSDTISSNTSEMSYTDVKTRAEDIRKYFTSLNYLEYAYATYPEVNFRYYLQPSTPLPASSGLDFSVAHMKGGINIGYNDAINAVGNNLYAASQFPTVVNTIYVN